MYDRHSSPSLSPYTELSRYGNSLQAGQSVDRMPVGARFSAPVQTGTGAHPASSTMGTGSFPGVKRPGRGADHPSPSKCRGHERVGLYLYSPSGLSWPVIGTETVIKFRLLVSAYCHLQAFQKIRESI